MATIDLSSEVEDIAEGNRYIYFCPKPEAVGNRGGHFANIKSSLFFKLCGLK